MEDNVIINRFDSFDEMKWKLGEKTIVFCEDEQDRYAIVNIKNSFEFGMAYNLYGIELMFGFDDKNDVCYIAAGQNLISIDIKNKEILFNHKLFTVILDLFTIENIVYILCDLELICYSDKKEKWRTAFREWVTDYELLENSRLWIDCEGRKMIINLKDGTVE